MKEFINDFLKLQNDRMKSPFFSAVVFSLLFYNWDLMYFLISSDLDAVVKIEYINKSVSERSLLKPFLLTAVLLILPIFINNAVQWLSDFFMSIRVNRLNKFKIRRASDELVIANSEAEKNFSTRKIEMHVQNNINAIKSENNNLKISVSDYKEQIEALKLSLDSEREASVDSRKHSDFLVNELENTKNELESFKMSVNSKDEDIFTLKELLAEYEKTIQSQSVEVLKSKRLLELKNRNNDDHFVQKDAAKFVGSLPGKNGESISFSYLTESENRNFTDEDFELIKRYFPSILSYDVFRILNKTPMPQSGIVASFPKDKFSLGVIRVALSKLMDTGMIEKTTKGVYFSSELGKKVDLELSQKLRTR